GSCAFHVEHHEVAAAKLVRLTLPKVLDFSRTGGSLNERSTAAFFHERRERRQPFMWAPDCARGHEGTTKLRGDLRQNAREPITVNYGIQSTFAHNMFQKGPLFLVGLDEMKARL